MQIKTRNPKERRGRKRLPANEKILNNMFTHTQWERIKAEAKAMNIEAAQYVRNMADWHFDQLDMRNKRAAESVVLNSEDKKSKGEMK